MPLEHYQVPDWIAEYGTELSDELGAPVTDKPGARAPVNGTAAQREEYNARVRENYEAVLNEAGIKTPEDHYQQLIADRTRSEELHQKMTERAKNDDRLAVLTRRLFG